MVLIALFAAILCIAAPFSISAGPIPITLATLAIYLAAVLLDTKKAVAAVAVYLLLGAVGLPVFSGFSGGIHRLIGPTGGYLIGYLPCAFLTAFLIEKVKHFWSYPLGMILGTAVLYGFGTAWYCLQSHTSFSAALPACVFPFLPGDALKIIAACTVGITVKKVMKKSD